MFCTPRKLALSICCLPFLLTLASNEAAAGAIPLNFTRTVAGANSADAVSGLAGAHAGYNWQQGGVVFGFETDLQAVRLTSSMNGGLTYTPPPPSLTDFARTEATIDWYGTLRGRVGVTFGSLLAYVTGGAAYGNVGLSSAFSAFGLTTQAQNNQTRVGGVVGFGFDYVLQPDLILSFGYQYVDLGRVSAVSSTAAPLGPFASAVLNQSATVRAQFQTATIGLTWRFAPASTGSPWAGGYAGVHGGGAWGNSASAVYNGVGTFIPN